MKSLRDYIQEAGEKKVAIGHFNVSDSEGFRAVVESATELQVPVIIGVSEGERSFIGIPEVAALVKVERDKGLPIFLNADHSYSVEKVKEAIDNGFDAAIIDCADKPFERKCSYDPRVCGVCEIQRWIRSDRSRAWILSSGQSSKILENIPEGSTEETQTKPEDAIRFIEATGVDLFAPSVGNIHGIVKGGEPNLNIERIRNIAQVAKVPLVLHGASGNSNEDIVAAIDAGIRIVHINTELRVAYKKGVEEGLKSGEVAPYKFMGEGLVEMKKVVIDKLKLFNKI